MNINTIIYLPIVDNIFIYFQYNPNTVKNDVINMITLKVIQKNDDSWQYFEGCERYLPQLLHVHLLSDVLL